MSANDSEAKAGYGLFQIAFSGLDTQLTQALVLLMRPAEVNLARSIVHALQFKIQTTDPPKGDAGIPIKIQTCGPTCRNLAIEA
jgi:hypothetical protein